jgi:hypothetical protein
MDSIEIKDRKFKFHVPTAFEGCAIFDQLTTYDPPFGVSNVVGLKTAKRPMPPAALETFMKLCLKNCTEELEGKPAPVIDGDGEIGIIGATSPLLTKLTAQFIVFFIDYWGANA